MKKLIALLIIATTCFNIQTQAQCGTTNIALSKTTAYSSQEPTHPASSIVDGSTSTTWWPVQGTSTPDDQFLTIDLGQDYAVCQVVVTWEDNTHQAANYKIQTAPASNSTAFTDAVSITGNSTVQVTHSITATGRYVKLLMSLRAVNWSAYSVKEIQVYASTGNQSPTVSITSPANNDVFTTGSNITINANAADADGSVSKVEFYQGATKLGEDLSSPYSFTWNAVGAGSYSLTAKATDNSSAITTSAAVNITVSSPPPSTGWSLTGNAATTPGTNFIGTTDNQRLVFKTLGTERMTVLGSGYVGINTANPSSELAVSGTITAKKVKVTQLGWADYVFEKDYRLMNLSELEAFIRQYKHLPDVPSAAKVTEQGIDVGDVQATLLKKIEELTLYMIGQNKQLEKQQQQLIQQAQAIKALKKQMNTRK